MTRPDWVDIEKSTHSFIDPWQITDKFRPRHPSNAMTTPTPSSDQPQATITADGKCASPIATIDTVGQLEVIELLIDGGTMRGGLNSPTLIGSSDSYLPESLHYTLSRFEPIRGGRCRVQYTRRRQA